jgi:peptide/nickel transport system permease protein
LGSAASFIGIVFGLAAGMFAALKPGSRRDVGVNTAAFVGISIPPYISAVLLQLLFAVYWSKWFGSTLFPTSGVYPPGQSGFDLVLMLKHMALPTFVVAIQIIAVYSRYMRSSLLDVLSSDYMRTARSKGISERQVLFRHGVRNALIPITTIAALDIGAIVGGLIITENIFDYPGMGKYFLKAFDQGDFPLVAHGGATALPVQILGPHGGLLRLRRDRMLSGTRMGCPASCHRPLCGVQKQARWEAGKFRLGPPRSLSPLWHHNGIHRGQGS